MRLRLPAALLTIVATGAFGQVPVTDSENLKERAKDEAQSTETKRSQDDSKKQAERKACNVMNKDFTRRLGMNIKDVIKDEPENVALIRAYAKSYGVPERVALSVAYAESRMSSCAGLPTGVKGVMQLTKRTGQDLGGFDRDINEQNIEGGVKLLGKAIGRCGETDFKCLASIYNGSTAAEQSGWAKTARRGHDQLSGATESDFPLPGPAYASANTGDMPASSPVKAALDRSSAVTKETGNRLAAYARTGPSNQSALRNMGDGAGEQERFQSAWDENTQARVQVGQLWNQAIDSQTMANMLLVARLVDEITRLSQVASIVAYDPRTANPFTRDCGLLALQGQAGVGCSMPGASRTAGANVPTADGGYVSLSPAAEPASVRDRLQQLQDAANGRDLAAVAVPPGAAVGPNDQINAALVALATAAGGN